MTINDNLVSICHTPRQGRFQRRCAVASQSLTGLLPYAVSIYVLNKKYNKERMNKR